MRQKVWVIDDETWDGAPKKSRAGVPSPLVQRQTDSPPLPKASQKSPALSFSLSMLVWGSGQMYSGAYGPGSIFLTAMLFFYSTISAAVFFGDFSSWIVAEVPFSMPVLVIAAAVFFLVALITWVANAVDAYYRAARLKSAPYVGVNDEIWPLFCSLLFAGWGQFLNGQTKKGLFFLLFGVTGVFSGVVCFAAQYVWPVLETSPSRLAFEIGFAVAFMLIPLSLLMWVVSAHDSFRSCREPCINRQNPQHAAYRVRSRWSVQRLIPRGTVILGLLLAISLGMQLVSQKYYLDFLEGIRIEMLNSNMELIPALIQQLIDVIGKYNAGAVMALLR